MENPKTNYLTLTLISLCFVLFISGAFYLGKQSTVTPEISVVPTKAPIGFLPKTTAIPTVISDPTTNWKTYTNTSLKVQFNYPSIWTIRGFAGDQENFNNSESTYTRFVIESPDNLMSITASGNIFEGAQDMCMSEQKPSTNQLIDGIVFTKSVFVSVCPESDIKFISLSSSAKKMSFVFNYTIKNQTESEKILNQILSTFKFTENKEQGYKLTENSGKNFILFLPREMIVNNPYQGNSYDISTNLMGGLCPLESVGADSCTYKDEKGTIWGTYRVWTKNSKPFAINPQNITLEKVYFDGMVITKTKSNEFFSQDEVSQWKDILNNNIVVE